MDNQTEVWKSHPEYAGIEVSTFGRVRTLDKVGSRENGTYSKKGHVLKPSSTKNGYLHVVIKVDGKWATKLVHRLVAQTFIPNPDNLPEINHKDNNPLNNGVSNLEWVTHEYNIAYREKYGTPAKDFIGKSPVYAINLATLEVSRFLSQHEASRVLGLHQPNINAVIKGRYKQAHGFWFVNAGNNSVDVAKRKLREIGKTKLASADLAIVEFTRQVNNF